MEENVSTRLGADIVPSWLFNTYYLPSSRQWDSLYPRWGSIILGVEWCIGFLDDLILW